MNLFKRSRTCTTLLVATGLLAGMLLYLPQNTRNDLKHNQFLCEKRYGKQQYDVLLLGDSRTYEGVSPQILQEYIPNMSIYNFGFSMGRINRELLTQASKRLKHSGKHIVIFGCTPLNIEKNGGNYQFFSIEKESLVSLFFKKVWIQGMHLNPNNPNKGTCIFHIPFGWAEVKRSKDEGAILATLEHYRNIYSSRHFFPPDFEHFVQNLKWCKKNNIKVVAYRMVSCREMDELEDKLNGVDWKKIKQAVLDEGFIWLERPPSPLLEQIEEHCYDGSHLNTEGSQMFSHWLGQELAKLDWFKENRQTSEAKK